MGKGGGGVLGVILEGGEKEAFVLDSGRMDQQWRSGGGGGIGYGGAGWGRGVGSKAVHEDWAHVASNQLRD